MKFITQRLLKPVDNSGLVLWRILLGFLLVAEAWGAILTGWLTETFVEPEFRFTFIGFEFLQMLSGEWMYLYNVVMGIFGLMIMVGWHYKIGVIGYFFMWAGIYFGQKSHYNNHYYLLLLLVGLMFFIPANAYASFDAKRKPHLKSLHAPFWAYFIFMLQFGIVYFYATLAKLYPDWLQAKPVSLWLTSKSDYWLIGPLLVQEWVHWAFSYGGIFYDGAIIPLLIFKKTRKIALVLSLVFHLTNSAVFHIGIFPFLAVSAVLLFWDPEQLRKIFFKSKPGFIPLVRTPKPSTTEKGLALFFICYFAVQIYLPLRHWFYESNVHWSEEGHRLSWQMMTRSKAGNGFFTVKDLTTGRRYTEQPSQRLLPHQVRSMPKRPDMIWQYAKYLEGVYHEKGFDSIAVYAHTRISLNGRKMQPLVNPNFDLTTVEKWPRFQTKEWITDLKE